MPRSCSSGRRSVSLPVSARTSHVLPWSMCPAVPTVSAMPGRYRRRRSQPLGSSGCLQTGSGRQSCQGSLKGGSFRSAFVAQALRQLAAEGAALDEGLELVLVLPAPTAVGLDDHVQCEVHRLKAELAAAEGLLQVHVPAPGLEAREPRGPERVPVAGAQQLERVDLSLELAVEP